MLNVYNIQDLDNAINDAWSKASVLCFADNKIYITDNEEDEEKENIIATKCQAYTNYNLYSAMAYRRFINKYMFKEAAANKLKMQTAEITEEKDIANKVIAYYKTYGIKVLEVTHEIISDTYSVLIEETYITEHNRISIREKELLFDRKEIENIIKEEL